MLKSIVAFLKKNIKTIMVVADIVGVLVAFLVASYLKFDAPTLFDAWFAKNMYYILGVDIAATLLCFLIFKVYKTTIKNMLCKIISIVEMYNSFSMCVNNIIR